MAAQEKASLPQRWLASTIRTLRRLVGLDGGRSKLDEDRSHLQEWATHPYRETGAPFPAEPTQAIGNSDVLCSQCGRPIPYWALVERVYSSEGWVCCSRCAIAAQPVCIKCGQAISNIAEVLLHWPTSRKEMGMICCPSCAMAPGAATCFRCGRFFSELHNVERAYTARGQVCCLPCALKRRPTRPT
jgi:hypothetical protein